MTRMLFSLGAVAATPGALAALGPQEIVSLLARHRAGDWGDLCVEDRRANDRALRSGGRLLSAYTSARGAKIWIITEAVGDDGNRAATTILLPGEY